MPTTRHTDWFTKMARKQSPIRREQFIDRRQAERERKDAIRQARLRKQFSGTGR